MYYKKLDKQNIMQTILGSGGVIGNALAKNLTNYTNKLRLVARNPAKVNAIDMLFPADITKRNELDEAIKESKIVYLTVGFPYKAKVWKELWPKVMTNTIELCKKHRARLVFFDNVYMYGKVNGWMTEETPYNPVSKKGEIRAKIATQLMNEVKAGNLKALIARSADFYGPETWNTAVTPMVFEKLKKEKSAQWLMNDQTKHSFIFTPDAGRATAYLGNAESAYNQIWHLPTNKNVLTGKEFIEEVAKAFNVAPDYSVLSKGMIKLFGLFNSMARESVEMLYQHEFDYLFDSTKFENKFFKATDYATGIQEVVKWMK